MAVADADIKRKFSINTGPGNSTVQGNPNDSIGGFMSSSEITNASLHNLFDLVSGAENAASESEYRCFFFHNAHATNTLYGMVVYILSETGGGSSINIGLATQGVVAANSASTQASRCTNEDTAPSPPVTFSAAPIGTPLAVGDLAPGQCIGIWVRRANANSAPLDLDNVIVRFAGDTAA